MLVTKQPVLRRFWYPVVPLTELSSGSASFKLLDTKIVCWLDADGNPAAVGDRCCHRSAQLSLGKVIDGNIACPYHGWRFDGSGKCVHVPQLTAEERISSSYKISTYRCKPRYGYAWVCLDEPIVDIPDIKEEADPSYRLIPEFYETWSCAGLRVMENEFDLAHPTFVHPTTFGSRANAY